MPNENDGSPILDIESFIGPIGGFAALPSAILGTIPFFNRVRKPLQQYLGIDISKYVIGIYVSAAVFFSLKRIWKGFKPWLLNRTTSSISIQTGTPAYEDVLNWVTEHVINRKSRWKDGARSLTIAKGKRSGVIDFSSMDMHIKGSSNKERSQPTHYVPSFVESTRIRQSWPWQDIFFHRQRPDMQPEKSGLLVDKSEITLSCIGFSTKPLKDFVDECRDQSTVSSNKVTTFYKNEGHYWQRYPTSRPNRPISTVDIDHGDRDALVADVARYLRPATHRFYARRGIPYRRGYLFHGPPGTGKTSMSLALAGHFNLTLYILNLAEFEQGDIGLAMLFALLPERCIVLLEDIDSAGVNREKIRLRGDRGDQGHQSGTKGASEETEKGKKKKKTGSKHSKAVTLSGLLNTVDGVGAREGRVVIMTSNDPDALDDALIRPGRVDWMVYFGPVKHHMAKAIFKRMYRKDVEDYEDPKEMLKTKMQEIGEPVGEILAGDFKLKFGELFNNEEQLEHLAESFVNKIPEDQFTPAEIQGFLLQYMDEPKQAVAKADGWVYEMVGKRESNQTIKEQAGYALNRTADALQAGTSTQQLLTSASSSSPLQKAGVIPPVDPALYHGYSPKGRPTSPEERKQQASFAQQWQERAASRTLPEVVSSKEQAQTEGEENDSDVSEEDEDETKDYGGFSISDLPPREIDEIRREFSMDAFTAPEDYKGYYRHDSKFHVPSPIEDSGSDESTESSKSDEQEVKPKSSPIVYELNTKDNKEEPEQLEKPITSRAAGSSNDSARDKERIGLGINDIDKIGEQSSEEVSRSGPRMQKPSQIASKTETLVSQTEKPESTDLTEGSDPATSTTEEQPDVNATEELRKSKIPLSSTSEPEFIVPTTKQLPTESATAEQSSEKRATETQPAGRGGADPKRSKIPLSKAKRPE